MHTHIHTYLYPNGIYTLSNSLTANMHFQLHINTSHPHMYTFQSYIHTYIHTNTPHMYTFQSYIHTYIHAYIHTGTHTHTYIHIPKLNLPTGWHIGKYMQSYPTIGLFSDIYTHTYIYICTCGFTYKPKYSPPVSGWLVEPKHSCHVSSWKRFQEYDSSSSPHPARTSQIHARAWWRGLPFLTDTNVWLRKWIYGICFEIQHHSLSLYKTRTNHSNIVIVCCISPSRTRSQNARLTR